MLPDPYKPYSCLFFFFDITWAACSISSSMKTHLRMQVKEAVSESWIIMTHLTRKLDWLGPSDKGMNYPDVSFSNLSTSSYKHLTSVHSSLPADEWNNKSIDSKMDSVIDRCNMVVIMMRPGIQCWWFISIVTHRPSHTFWSKGCKLSREIPAMSLDRARPSIIGLGNRCNPAKPEPRDIGPAVTWSLDSI